MPDPATLSESKAQARRWPQYTAIGVLVAIFVLLFVVPGFIAGAYIRAKHDFQSESYVENYDPKDPLFDQRYFCDPRLKIFLIPANFLRGHSVAYNRFFLRQLIKMTDDMDG